MFNKERRRKYLKEWRRKWRLANKDKCLLLNRRYRLLNKEKIARYNKQYRAEHKQEMSIRDKQYYENKYRDIRKVKSGEWRKTLNGRLCSIMKNHNRRMYTNYLTVRILQQVYEENIKKYGTLTCELCLKPVEFRQDSIDHKIPISRKDEFPRINMNSRENLEIAHKLCNYSKGSKTLDEWFLTKIGGLNGSFYYSLLYQR